MPRVVVAAAGVAGGAGGAVMPVTGDVGFSLAGGGGGGSIEPPKTGGGVRERGSIDRTINQLL